MPQWTKCGFLNEQKYTFRANKQFNDMNSVNSTKAENEKKQNKH